MPANENIARGIEQRTQSQGEPIDRPIARTPTLLDLPTLQLNLKHAQQAHDEIIAINNRRDAKIDKFKREHTALRQEIIDAEIKTITDAAERDLDAALLKMGEISERVEAQRPFYSRQSALM